MKVHTLALSLWEYAGEFLCALLLSGLLFVTQSTSSVSDFMARAASEFNRLVLVLFSASLAIWLTFINITGSDFGEYLRFKKCYAVFNRAFLTPVVVYFLASLSLILTIATDYGVVAKIAIFFLLYGALNLITMIRNSTGLICLYSHFRTEARKTAKNAAKGADSD